MKETLLKILKIFVMMNIFKQPMDNIVKIMESFAFKAVEVKVFLCFILKTLSKITGICSLHSS
jgi:hypothetical protein